MGRKVGNKRGRSIAHIPFYPEHRINSVLTKYRLSPHQKRNFKNMMNNARVEK